MPPRGDSQDRESLPLPSLWVSARMTAFLTPLWARDLAISLVDPTLVYSRRSFPSHLVFSPERI